MIALFPLYLAYDCSIVPPVINEVSWTPPSPFPNQSPNCSLGWHVTHSLPALNKVPTRFPRTVPPTIITKTTTTSFLVFASVLHLFSSLVRAHGDSDKMDGTMMGGTMTGGTMTMYLHFTPGSSVLFGPWIPETDQAIFGTCVGLFMLAMVDRWFSAIAAVMNAYWNKK